MKRLIMVPFALLIAVAAWGQGEPSRKAFSVGPVLGFGHAWMSPVVYSEYHPSYSAGAFAIYSPVENWGVGMDVRYSIEGTKRDYPEGGIVKEQYDYLRVPVRAMYFWGDWGDDFRPKITVGPSMGFLLKHTGPAYISEKKFDFGLTASGGFNYRIYGNTWLNTDVGYYHGLTDAVENTNNSEKHRNIMLNMGIGFEI